MYTIVGISTITEFHGIEMWLLKKAIQSLALSGQAELISTSDESDTGVKFFS